MRCSPAILCLTFLVPASPAQGPADGTLLSSEVLVRMAPNEVALNGPLLSAVAGSADLRQAVVKALGKRLADPARCQVTANERTVPQPAGVFQFTLFVNAALTNPLDAAAETAVLQAAVDVIRQRLETMLTEGPRRDLTHRVQELETRLKQAEAEREEANLRLLQLGGGDPAATQKQLAELQHRRLDLDLDLRTEEGLQVRLQTLINDARRRLADAGARVHAVASESNRLSSELAHQRKSLELAGDRATLEALKKELADGEARFQDLQRQRAIATDAAAAEARLVDELASQATASTIALNRHVSRMQVLQSALEQQGIRENEALARAAERGKIEQGARRCDDLITMLRSRLSDVTQRLETLQPIRVDLWR